MTSVSASGGRSPVRLCRIVPQTNDPPAWLKAGRAFSFLAALTPRPLRRSIVTVRIPRPSSPLGFRSTGFGASVIVFPVIALQGRQIAFERLCGHPRTSRPEPSLQGRQIAFERLCGHPRTSRPEPSGEVRNCQPKPSNRFSDLFHELTDSSAESIASSSDFIEHSALLKASRVVEPLSEGSDGFQLLNVLLRVLRSCQTPEFEPPKGALASLV